MIPRFQIYRKQRPQSQHLEKKYTFFHFRLWSGLHQNNIPSSIQLWQEPEGEREWSPFALFRKRAESAKAH